MSNATSLVFALDDERDNLDLLERTLHGLCDLRTFADPPALLAAAKLTPPDLVLLDQRLPSGSGSEVLKSLREAGCECGVVLITGYPELPEVQQALTNQDAFWVVPKPWVPEQLVSQVSMALPLSRMRARLKRSAKRPV